MSQFYCIPTTFWSRSKKDTLCTCKMGFIEVYILLVKCYFCFSSGIKDGLSRKDELHNKVIDWMEERRMTLRNPNTEGRYITQVEPPF